MAKLKYRAHHYYPDEPFMKYKYDHLDFSSKIQAIKHCQNSRTCQQVRVIQGHRDIGQVNLRTGKIE